jgi:hypothetical protein
MKRFGGNIILSILLMIPFFAYGAEGGSYAYTIAKSGLIIRSEPSRSGKLVTILKRNTRVKIIETSAKSETIETVTANWYKIKYFDIEGWVFGGFIIKFQDAKKAYINNTQNSFMYKDPKSFKVLVAEIPYRSQIEIITNEQPQLPEKNSMSASIKVKYGDLTGWIYDMDVSFIEIPDYLPGYDKKNQAKYNADAEKYYFSIFNSFGETKDEIVKKIGKPLKVTETPVKNRHDDTKTDYNILLKYKDFEISLLRVSDNRFILTGIAFTSLAYVKKDPYLNAPIKNVYSAFGIPHLDMDSYVAYGVTESQYSRMLFYHTNGVVRKIVLELSPD